MNSWPDSNNFHFQLIFSGEYTKAMNKDWHSDHFCCWQCDTTLTGQRYILRDEHPYCIKCYEEVFANTCDECGKAIGIDSKVSPSKELLMTISTFTGLVIQRETLARGMFPLFHVSFLLGRSAVWKQKRANLLLKLLRSSLRYQM